MVRLPRAAAAGVTCRPMAEADLPFIAALYATTRSDEVAATGWPEALRQSFLAQQHQAQHDHYQAHYPTAQWLIVEMSGERVGRLYLDDYQDDLHLIDISLLPERRGGGIGTAILEDLLDWARGEGKTMSLYVEPFNPARRLYARFGFVPEGEIGVYERMVWQAASTSS